VRHYNRVQVKYDQPRDPKVAALLDRVPANCRLKSSPVVVNVCCSSAHIDHQRPFNNKRPASGAENMRSNRERTVDKIPARYGTSERHAEQRVYRWFDDTAHPCSVNTFPSEGERAYAASGHDGSPINPGPAVVQTVPFPVRSMRHPVPGISQSRRGSRWKSSAKPNDWVTVPRSSGT